MNPTNSGRSAALLALISACTFSPASALACACGCGVFDVGAGTLPGNSSARLTAWLRYSEMDQNQNWESGGKAPAADNTDKDLRTSLYTVGGQYMIDHNWTVMAELPIYDRSLTTTDDGSVFGPAGSQYTGHLVAQGDLQITGMYTGFSPDMSTGLTFGVKLPTGDWSGPKGPLGGAEFDRDSLPGTGSTDLMVGGYHVGQLNAEDTLFYFVQARYQFAIATRDDYRPGNELDAAVGATYDLGAVGPLSKLAPVLQLLDSYRAHDSGAAADPLNSGYERLLFAPGVTARWGQLRVYGDVELPLYQHANAAFGPAAETSGQLVAPFLIKTQVSYDF
jgi:hypothetical protein